jgi:hypothetical protein
MVVFGALAGTFSGGAHLRYGNRRLIDVDLPGYG